MFHVDRQTDLTTLIGVVSPPPPSNFANGAQNPLTQLTPVLFVVGTHLDTNGSPTGYHSVTFKKKDIQWHFLLTFWHRSFTFKF
jgi:hypothetical protein